MVLIGWVCFKLKKIFNFFIKKYQKYKFNKIGKSVYIGDNGIFTYKNICIGNDVYIGANACFQSTYGEIIIGDHVMFGPGVNIHGGNHKIKEIGYLLKHTPDKKQGDDGRVVIEEDCWIGANAIILSGVTIGKGSVVAAGAIVTKDIPPYSIYKGVPPRNLTARFNMHELELHKKSLEKIYN